MPCTALPSHSPLSSHLQPPSSHLLSLSPPTYIYSILHSSLIIQNNFVSHIYVSDCYRFHTPLVSYPEWSGDYCMRLLSPVHLVPMLMLPSRGIEAELAHPRHRACRLHNRTSLSIPSSIASHWLRGKTLFVLYSQIHDPFSILLVAKRPQPAGVRLSSIDLPIRQNCQYHSVEQTVLNDVSHLTLLHHAD